MNEGIRGARESPSEIEKITPVSAPADNNAAPADGFCNFLFFAGLSSFFLRRLRFLETRSLVVDVVVGGDVLNI